jgi:hypothetical protein
MARPDVHIAGTDLDYEQAVQALERHGAEVRGEHGRCLAQELPPRGVTYSVRHLGYLQCLADAADRGCAGAATERKQLTLDPLVSPEVILGSEPLDERSEDCAVGPIQPGPGLGAAQHQRRFSPLIAEAAARCGGAVCAHHARGLEIVG